MMIRPIFFLLLVAVICPGQSQSKTDSRATSGTAQSYLIKKLSSSGSQRFAESDILKATGLRAGASMTAEDLQQAANRLGQSGVFFQVSYRYNGEVAQFDVVDAQQFVPASFENFIWFSDAELVRRAHEAVSLFNGSVPLNGNLSDQICAALDAILKEKGVQGHTAAMMSGKLSGQLQAMRFQIEGVNAKISEIRFLGAAPAHAPLLLEATQKSAGESYQQTFFAQVIKLNAPGVYGRLGFLKAQFGTPKPVILKDDPSQPLVAIEVPVVEGDQYTFLGSNWSGAQSISPADLAKMVDLKVGAPADTNQMGKAITRAKELYGTKGHMNAQVRSTASLDNEKHTAVFNLTVDEGPLYHMGKLEVQGPDPQRVELAKKIWEMHEGDVYDASYVKTFMTKHPRELSTLNGWRPSFTQTVHDDTHVVDLNLKFERFQQEAR